MPKDDEDKIIEEFEKSGHNEYYCVFEFSIVALNYEIEQMSVPKSSDVHSLALIHVVFTGPSIFTYNTCKKISTY